MRTSHSPSAGSSCAERRHGCSWRHPGPGSDGTGGPSPRGVSDHGIVAVAEERLVQELHVLADRSLWHVLREAFLRRLERTKLDVGEALDLQIELEEIRWDRPQVLRIVPERVRADRKGLGVRGDEDDGRAGRERAAACPKDFAELARKDVLGEVTGVETVDAPRFDLPQMREGVDLVRLEPLLAALRDHPRIEIHPITADALVPQQLQEDAATRSQVEHALAPLVEVDERLRLPADDRLVAPKARLEVHGVEVRGDLALAPLFPLALETLEPRAEARRHLSFVVIGGSEQPVDALLALEDRPHPPAHERDDDLPRVGDDRTNDRFAAARVVLDILVEGLRERRERVLEVVGEDPPTSRTRSRRSRRPSKIGRAHV